MVVESEEEIVEAIRVASIEPNVKHFFQNVGN